MALACMLFALPPVLRIYMSKLNAQISSSLRIFQISQITSHLHGISPQFSPVCCRVVLKSLRLSLRIGAYRWRISLPPRTVMVTWPPLLGTVRFCPALPSASLIPAPGVSLTRHLSVSITVFLLSQSLNFFSAAPRNISEVTGHFAVYT